MFIRLLLVAAALIFVMPLRSAQAEFAVFSSRLGVAIGGYDTVAFFEENKAVPGHRQHAVMWKGVIWQFATARNQSKFESNPWAYAPRFGGYCAYAMSRGYVADGNPQLWAISGGQLYLLNNPGAMQEWRSHTADMIATALGNWPDLLKSD